MNQRDTPVIETCKFLLMHGIDAKQMPELKRRTCDIVASSGQHRYFIEVKERLGPQKPGSYKVNDGYSSSVHKIVEDAVKQLSAMPSVDGVYRVIWFVIPDDSDDERLLRGIQKTLYGIERLELRKGTLQLETDCFFFLFPALAVSEMAHS